MTIVNISAPNWYSFLKTVQFQYSGGFSTSLTGMIRLTLQTSPVTYGIVVGGGDLYFMWTESISQTAFTELDRAVEISDDNVAFTSTSASWLDFQSLIASGLCSHWLFQALRSLEGYGSGADRGGFNFEGAYTIVSGFDTFKAYGYAGSESAEIFPIGIYYAAPHYLAIAGGAHVTPPVTLPFQGSVQLQTTITGGGITDDQVSDICDAISSIDLSPVADALQSDLGESIAEIMKTALFDVPDDEKTSKEKTAITALVPVARPLVNVGGRYLLTSTPAKQFGALCATLLPSVLGGATEGLAESIVEWLTGSGSGQFGDIVPLLKNSDGESIGVVLDRFSDMFRTTLDGSNAVDIATIFRDALMKYDSVSMSYLPVAYSSEVDQLKAIFTSLQEALNGSSGNDLLTTLNELFTAVIPAGQKSAVNIKLAELLYRALYLHSTDPAVADIPFSECVNHISTTGEVFGLGNLVSAFLGGNLHSNFEPISKSLKENFHK